jgi:deoxyribose-phosphate aldolase
MRRRAPASTEGNLLERLEHSELCISLAYADIRRVCLEALHYGFGAVVVYPARCACASEILHGSSVRVVAVIGYPTGAFTIDGKVFEARDAIGDGALEIDYVVNVGALRSGSDDVVRREMAALRDATRGCRLTAVVESEALTDAQKLFACEAACAEDVDGIRTSTGAASFDGTLGDVRLLRGVAGDRIGIKAAGDIRTLDQVRELLDLGATQVCTSAGVRMAEEMLRARRGAA